MDTKTSSHSMSLVQGSVNTGAGPYTSRSWSFLHWRPSRHLALIAGSLCGLMILSGFALSGLVYAQDDEINFDYSQANCLTRPVLLPGSGDYSAGKGFTAKLDKVVSIGGLKLYAGRACIEPIAPLNQGSDIITGRYGGIFKTEITVNHSAPVPKPVASSSESVSPLSDLQFDLSEPDIYLDYVVNVGDSESKCKKSYTKISCSLKSLGLEYSAQYNLSIYADLNDRQAPIYTSSISTIDSLQAISSNLVEGQIVYDNPATVSLLFNRPLEQSGSAELNGQVLQQTINLDSLTLTMPDKLDRLTDYTLTLAGYVATDGSGQEAPVVINFYTAGSPKVASITAPDVGLPVGDTIKLNFDYDLDPNQDLKNIVSLTAGGTALPTGLTISGSNVLVNPSGNLPSCTDIAIKVAPGIMNVYGVSDDQAAYSKTVRTQCATVSSIGKSVNGRSIVAYSFGSGPKSILFYGALHGNEKSSKYILDSLISDLEANPSLIPANVKINIVPNANPDGFAAGSRFNANNVDLNRNYDTYNWKSDIVIKGGSTLYGGGGSAPMSEPETQAIANFTLSSGADLVVYYHALANMTIANGTPNSYYLASRYASISGYPDRSTTDANEIFSYDIVGDYGDWTKDRGVDGVLIELRTYSSNEYTANRAAIMEMIKSVQ